MSTVKIIIILLLYFNSELKMKLVQALGNAENEIHDLANSACNGILQTYRCGKVWFSWAVAKSDKVWLVVP